MGIYVTGYTEAKIDGKWQCIDFWQPDKDGKLHHVPCITGQSMIAQALEWDCKAENVGVPEDMSDQVRAMNTHEDGALIGTKQTDGRPWYIIQGRWFEKADLEQPEFCGFFPRQDIAAHLANPDEMEINEENMVTAGEYRGMDEAEKKAYQYYEYTPLWGNRSILRRFKADVVSRMNAWNNRTMQELTLLDIRVLLTMW